MGLTFIHANLANTVMLFMLIAGTWGVVLHFRKQGIGGNYWGILAVGELLVLAQGALGGILWVGGALPGFEPGDPIVFRVRDSKARESETRVAATWLRGNGVFGRGCYAVVALEVPEGAFESDATHPVVGAVQAADAALRLDLSALENLGRAPLPPRLRDALEWAALVHAADLALPARAIEAIPLRYRGAAGGS